MTIGELARLSEDERRRLVEFLDEAIGDLDAFSPF
jgi:dihydrodipicolinate synthase/N-acetylneuraminate lyase